MRLFVAIDLDDSVRERVSRFVDRMREFAPQARWMPPESLHVTLKFIGEASDESTGRIKKALEKIAPPAFHLTFRGHGFFPTPKAPRVFWIGLEAGTQLASLASLIDGSLAELAIPREAHVFTPHLTLARGPGGSGSPARQKGDQPNRSFHELQEYLRTVLPPEFGSITVGEFFLYQSRLSPTGSRYTKLAAYPLS